MEAVHAVAHERGYARVSLETGTYEALVPARRLYEHLRFEVCDPFGDHTLNHNSVCMTLWLSSD